MQSFRIQQGLNRWRGLETKDLNVDGIVNYLLRRLAIGNWRCGEDTSIVLVILMNCIMMLIERT